MPGVQERRGAIEANLVIANKDIFKNRKEEAIGIMG